MKEIIGYEEKLFHTYKLYKQRQTWRNLQDTEKCLQKQRYNNSNLSTLYVRWTGKLHTRKMAEMSSKKKDIHVTP